MLMRPTAWRAVVCLGLALLPTGAWAQASRDRAARRADDTALALECRTALWKATFDEATAAGLNPGAVPVSFDTAKAHTTRDGRQLTVTGVEDYQPSHQVAAFAVRYTCIVDLASKAVTRVTYDAVDDDGNALAKRPVQIVREGRYVEACRSEIDSKVHSDAIDRGVTAGGSNAEPDPWSVSVTTTGTKTEIAGSGRVRLSKDYNWEPMTFTCRYDEKKREVTKVSYRIDGGSGIGALSPERERALRRCRLAVREAVADDAERRGYRWWRGVEVTLERFGNFSETGQRLDVTGEGWFRTDPSHSERTPITFACAYDIEGDRVLTATFEAGNAARTPSGEIATGPTSTLVCESRYSGNTTCPAKIRGNVRVIRQISRTPCEAYKNWIYSTSGITVWGGCRAEFEFDAR